jgi:hypothetical protein
MADSEQITNWKLFTPAEITACFRGQGVRSIYFCAFCSSKMARLSAGCVRDGLGLKVGMGGFHATWQRQSLVHM